MKRIFAFLLTLTIVNISYGQIDISAARAKTVGETVTIRGIVTNGDELGPIRYIQDATGALPAYSPGNFADMAPLGTEVSVTGVLKDFNSLLELDPVSNFTIHSTGNPLPTPKLIIPSQLNESVEGQLVKIENVTFANGGSVFASGSYNFTAGGQSGQVFIRANHPMIGTPIPLATVELIGIASQFRTTYQLLLRTAADITIADNFFLTANPVQSNISTSGFDITWTTNTGSTTKLKYGKTPALTEETVVPGITTTHTVQLTGLEPATFYYAQAISEKDGTEKRSPVGYYSTASNSTGEIQVHFNYSVDNRFSNGSAPLSTSPAALEAAIIDRINQAKKTVDIAMYNNNRTTTVAALANAHNRGVRVRYVTGLDTQNPALTPAPPFEVFAGNPDALMHNKFLAIDAELEDDAWLIAGSLNFTNQNEVDDNNNMLFIQDQALVKCYVVEFEEMWGSSDASPGIFSSSFGSLKRDNTPHLFSVNGTTIESYFSPSDKTTLAIERAVRTADTDFQFALLTMTRNELGTAALDMHRKGVAVRGLIENTGDQGSEFQFLVDNGVRVEQADVRGLLHHKYGIVDATNPASNPLVITGSHNWTAAAETVNDENTLIIYHRDVANIFLQEFEQRWCEVTTPGNCLSSILEPSNFNLEFTYSPNPTTDFVNLTFKQPSPRSVIKVLDAKGRTLFAKIENTFSNTTSISLAHYPAGNYWIVVEQDGRKGVAAVVRQ